MTDYPNGQIPTSAMVKVQNAWFLPECGKPIAAAIAECATYGIHVNINEGYRPLGVPADRTIRDERKTSTGGSNQYFQKGREDRGETPSAAVPGHSVHGAGRAADVDPGRNNSTVASVFAKHGFAFDISSESWHAHYVGGSVAPALDGRQLQALLNVFGYKLEVDGIVGAKTTAAVKDFQKKHGLEVDGVAGPKTLAALRAGQPKPVTPPKPVAPVTSITPAPVAPVTPIKPVEPVTPIPELVKPTPAPEPVKPEEKPVPVVDTVEQEKEIASLPATDLGAIIPSAKGRKLAYAGYMVASLAVTNTAIGFAALHAEFPAWLIVSIAVVGNLATPFGALAIANAAPKK